MSYQPGILIFQLAVMGIDGAWGSMNLTSSSFCRRRQFSTADAQPWPVSPRPWMNMTVAVCRATAGKRRGGADIVLGEPGASPGSERREGGEKLS
jgi:hypothetical protein